MNNNYPSDGSLYTNDHFNKNGPQENPYDVALAFVDASGQTAHGGHCPRHCREPSFEIYDGTNPEDCTAWTFATGVSLVEIKIKNYFKFTRIAKMAQLSVI